MKRKSGLDCALVILFAAIPLSISNSANAESHSRKAGEIVRIEASVPDSIKLVSAPDTDNSHYKTINDTHFSYRCDVKYTTQSKKAATEVCEINPVTLEIISWPETEFINLISGEVTITGADGMKQIYSSGDIFVLPQGFNGTWSQSEKLLKVVVRHPLYWKD